MSFTVAKQQFSFTILESRPNSHLYVTTEWAQPNQTGPKMVQSQILSQASLNIAESAVGDWLLCGVA